MSCAKVVDQLVAVNDLTHVVIDLTQEVVDLTQEETKTPDDGDYAVNHQLINKKKERVTIDFTSTRRRSAAVEGEARREKTDVDGAKLDAWIKKQEDEKAAAKAAAAKRKTRGENHETNAKRQRVASDDSVPPPPPPGSPPPTNDGDQPSLNGQNLEGFESPPLSGAPTIDWDQPSSNGQNPQGLEWPLPPRGGLNLGTMSSELVSFSYSVDSSESMINGHWRPRETDDNLPDVHPDPKDPQVVEQVGEVWTDSSEEEVILRRKAAEEAMAAAAAAAAEPAKSPEERRWAILREAFLLYDKVSGGRLIRVGVSDRRPDTEGDSGSDTESESDTESDDDDSYGAHEMHHREPSDM